MKIRTAARAAFKAAVFYCIFAFVCQMARGQQEVRFRLVRETAIVVPALVNGTGPFDFVLDTGTTTTLLDADLARRLSLPAIDRTQLHTVAGTRILVRSSISTLAIGSADAKNLEALVGDLSEVKKLDARIVGMVGQNFLLQQNYLIDYRRHVLSFESTDEIGKRVSGERLPLEIRELRMMVLAETHSGSQNKLRLTLDSGANSVVLFRRSSHAVNAAMQPATFDAATVNGNGLLGQAHIHALKIGSQTFYDVTAALPPPSPAEAQRLEDGLLPASFFHIVYINNRDAFAIFNPHVESIKKKEDPHQDRISD